MRRTRSGPQIPLGLEEPELLERHEAGPKTSSRLQPTSWTVTHVRMIVLSYEPAEPYPRGAA